MKRSNRLVLLIGVFLAAIAFVGIAILLSKPPEPTTGPTAVPTQLPTVKAAYSDPDFQTPTDKVLQQVLGRGDLLLTPNERSGLDGQIVGVGIERLEGREISRVARGDELVEAVGLLQVLEAMGSQVTQACALR